MKYLIIVFEHDYRRQSHGFKGSLFSKSTKFWTFFNIDQILDFFQNRPKFELSKKNQLDDLLIHKMPN